jgi:transcriptional regulator with XRE-family HTH domain
MAAKPNPIDVHVGARLRQRRILLGMSQEKLGDAIGLTFQQVQKYEHGANRIGASRLFDVARVLEVPVSFFFEEIDLPATGSNRAAEAVGNPEADPMAKREALNLVRAYLRIHDPQTRRRLYDLTKAIANADRMPCAAD